MEAGGGGGWVGCRKLVKFFAEQTAESSKRIALNIRTLTARQCRHFLVQLCLSWLLYLFII